MIDTLLAYAAENQLFTGLVGASAVGAVAFLARSLPAAALNAARWAFTVELKVSNHDDFFWMLSEWLGSQDHARRVRRLRSSEHRHFGEAPVPGPASLGNEGPHIYLAPGEGWHWFRHRDRWLWYAHEIEKGERGSVNQYITLRIFGRTQAPIRALVSEILEARKLRAGIDVRVWANGYWQRVSRKALRPMASVFSPHGDALLADARWFFESEPWYAERGVPWRRGYLLVGEPGTGKTSMVLALASELRRPIYVLNLGSFGSDEYLSAAFLQVPAGSVLLIEDIDVAKASRDRAPRKVGAPPNGASKKDEPELGITTSGLLNAIDGVIAADGRLLVMTTNHPEALDPALTRPGRIDLRVRFERINFQTGIAMLDRFFPNSERQPSDILELDWPATPAQVQGALMQLRQDARP